MVRIPPEQVHRLADKKGIVWDAGAKGSARFIAMCVRLTGKSHLDDMKQHELLKVMTALRKISKP